MAEGTAAFLQTLLDPEDWQAMTNRDVVLRSWLVVVCNPKRPSGISANSLERKAAQAVADTIEDSLKKE